MHPLNYFDKYVPKYLDTEPTSFEVWSYSRVSSKEQFDNNSSVNRQIEANDAYAKEKGYTIVEKFGGTYESAKSDFTRKEFSRLIDKVRKSKKKPYAILVYKMSRFSRSGGNAIGLVNALVEEQGVHLIEVSSGLSTTTDRGRVAIYESLFHAHKENLERKEIIIPNMRAFLKNGNRFGSSPIGYDHFGPRVSDGRFLSKEQKVVINADGEILREAWKWKLSGSYSDAQIIAKMEARGLTMMKQQVSKMWRNPFYCGILINKLAGEPVKGNWEPIVSIDNFVKLQEMLSNNPGGYQHKKDEPERPLTRTLKCNHCDSHMVGYVVKKKNLHYYRCLNCSGVSISAHKGRQKAGAEDLFSDLLDKYRVPATLEPLIALQLSAFCAKDVQRDLETQQQLKRKKDEITGQLKQIKIRRGLNQIDEETFALTKEHLTEQLAAIEKESASELPKISNLENLITKSLQLLQNPSEIWGSSDLTGKRLLQKTFFPDGIFYDAQKHQYLTRKVNNFLELTSSLTLGYDGNEKATSSFFDEKSLSVPRRRLEPKY